MKIAFFDTHSYEKSVFEQINQKYKFDINFLPMRLNEKTMQLAEDHDAVCCFVNDRVTGQVLSFLKESGVKLVALRSAGFNHVDIFAAQKIGLPVVRVPEYSPHAVAELAVALLLSLNRKVHRAYARVREMNFSLEGLVGFDLFGKTVGIVGTGKIGTVFAEIMLGFGCKVLAYDLQKNSELEKAGVRYTELTELYKSSDIVSLHVPLTPKTRYLIDSQAFSLMKKGVILINTGRGALIKTSDLIKALKTRHLGGAGLDVYEEEEGIFFEDLSISGVDDDQLARLLTFPNVLITSHQGFLTQEALQNIATTTLENITEFANQRPLTNQVTAGSNKI